MEFKFRREKEHLFHICILLLVLERIQAANILHINKILLILFGSDFQY